MPEFNIEGVARNVEVRATVTARNIEAAQRKVKRGDVLWWYGDDQPDFTVTANKIEEI